MYHLEFVLLSLKIKNVSNNIIILQHLNIVKNFIDGNINGFIDNVADISSDLNNNTLTKGFDVWKSALKCVNNIATGQNVLNALNESLCGWKSASSYG